MLSGKVHPLHNNIVIRKKQRLSDRRIIISDEGNHNTLHFGIVERVGKGVLNLSITEGFYIAYDSHQVNDLGNGEVLINEHDAVAVSINGTWKPLGPNVMILRNNEEQTTSGGLIIPACYQTADQNMMGVVTAIGLINLNKYDDNLKVGDMVKIARWDNSIFEISVGELYHLIVPHNLLEYKKEETEA